MLRTALKTSRLGALVFGGAELADRQRMCAARLLTIALLVATFATAAAADPITHHASASTGDPLDIAFHTPLLDATGVPFMMTGAPVYHGGVASSNEGEGSGDGSGTPGVLPSVGTVLYTYIASTGGGGTTGGSTGSTGGNVTQSSVLPGTTGGGNTASPQIDSSSNQLLAVPEAGTLLLMAPALALGFGRRLRRAKTQ
jgi:hypothetical protein